MLNASLYGVLLEARESGAVGAVYGAIGGSEGILKERFLNLSRFPEEELKKLLTTPGTAIGSSRYALEEEDYKAMEAIFRKHHIRYVLFNGGNGTMDACGKLVRALGPDSDIRVAGIPKTIDNDIFGTDMTFGFQSAVEIATNAIDCIHTTATSHGRVFIVEIMGHKVGSLTLHAGGADIILIPEIPYDIKKVTEAIQKRNKAGKRFTILAVAEGAISKEDAKLPKKKYKEKLEARAKKYPSVSYEIADEIFKEIGSEVRVTVPGHIQRGGQPCPYDRVLSTRIGAGAAEAILDEEYGVMIGVVNGKIKRVPLAECAGKLKMVSPKDQTVKAAKQIGISFGD